MACLLLCVGSADSDLMCAELPEVSAWTVCVLLLMMSSVLAVKTGDSSILEVI
jgi:hypothetical protein